MSAPNPVEVRVPDALALSLASGHPWIYRDHVPRRELPNGAWVKVQAASFTAFGLWDAESAIAIRVFSTLRVPDAAWIEERVREAYSLREPVRRAGVSGYRLIYGEADQLPGIVVDLYADVAIVVVYSDSVRSLVPLVAKAVSRLPAVSSVVLRSKVSDKVRLELLAGKQPEAKLVIAEGARLLWAELDAGQKTGLFFDHRDNRDFVSTVSEDLRVLNLFSYTGGFSVAAAQGGAASVTSVDIAAPAIEGAKENFALNGLTTPHEAIAEDVFAFLEREGNKKRQWDLVVSDPPSFAKNREQVKAAEKAYVRLMAAGLRVVAPGGMFCAASCTSQIGPAQFRRLLADAVRKARVRFQIVRDIGHAPDHPVLAGHEEGRYLKFLAGRVLPRA